MDTGLTIDYISDKLILAQQYYAELVNKQYINLQNNIENNQSLEADIFWLYIICNALYYRTSRDILDETTISLYKKLEKRIGIGTTTSIQFNPFFIDIDNKFVVQTSVDLSLYALDSTVVHKGSSETIIGIKTFTQSPLVPDSTLDTQAVNLGTVKSTINSNLTGYVPYNDATSDLNLVGTNKGIYSEFLEVGHGSSTGSGLSALLAYNNSSTGVGIEIQAGNATYEALYVQPYNLGAKTIQLFGDGHAIFAGPITGNLFGNASTVTNGVYTTGSYSNPTWISSLDYSKLTGTPSSLPPSGSAGGDLSGTYPNPTINTINSITKSYYDPTSSIQTQLNSKQDTLISGTNIKTINSGSLLGSGNILLQTPLVANIDYLTPKSVSTLRFTLSGDNCRFDFLTGSNASAPHTLVIYFHGDNENEDDCFTQPLEKTVTDALIQQGYFVVSAFGTGNGWGNQASQDAYYNLYNYMKGTYNISKVIFIGQSMGGLASLNLVASGRIPVDAWYGIYPVTNLNWVYNNGFSSEIIPAYGITGGNPYATATAGYDPNLAANSSFSNSRYNFIASYSDLIVSRAQNTDLMTAKVALSGALQNQVLTCFGNHGDPSAFVPSSIINFISQEFLSEPLTYRKTFFGPIVAGGYRSNTPNPPSLNNDFVGNHSYWSLRTGVSNDGNIDVYNSSSPLNVFKWYQNGDVAFPQLTTNALLKTTSSNGTVGYAVAGTDYLTPTGNGSSLTGFTSGQITTALGFTPLAANQNITLSGDISGSGTTSITTAIGAGKVTNTMLAGSIDWSKIISPTHLTLVNGSGIGDATIDGLTVATTNSSYTTRGRLGSNFDVAYLTQNAMFNGASWVADNTGRATATITLSANNADGNINFYTANTNNAGQGTLAGTVDKNQNWLLVGNLSANVPAYSSGTYLPAIYNSTNNRFETSTNIPLLNSNNAWSGTQTFGNATTFNFGATFNSAITLNQQMLHKNGYQSIYYSTGNTFTITLDVGSPTGNRGVVLPDADGVIDLGYKRRLTGSGTGAATTISIPHGLTGVTSSSIAVVTPINAASAGISYITTDTTNVNIVYTVAPASGTNNLSYNVSIKP